MNKGNSLNIRKTELLYYFCELFNVKKIAYYVTRR